MPSRSATINISAAIPVTVVALAWLVSNAANQGSRYAADCRADRGTANVSGGNTPDHGAGGCTNTGALLGRSACGHGGGHDHNGQNSVHFDLLLQWSSNRGSLKKLHKR
jgi:hypothetical protein